MIEGSILLSVEFRPSLNQNTYPNSKVQAFHTVPRWLWPLSLSFLTLYMIHRSLLVVGTLCAVGEEGPSHPPPFCGDPCLCLATRCRGWSNSRETKPKKKKERTFCSTSNIVGVIWQSETSNLWQSWLGRLGKAGSCPRICMHGLWNQVWVRAHSSAHTN